MQNEMGKYFDVCCFPETGYFLDGLDNYAARIKAMYRLQSMYSNKVTPPYNFLFKLNKTKDAIKYWTPQLGLKKFFYCITSKEHSILLWVTYLDQLANKLGYSTWVEKTPKHFYRLEYIEAISPKPYIIYIIRQGNDVVASIYDRSLKYPHWFGHENIEFAINLWNSSVNIALEKANNSECIFVRYEDLINRKYSLMTNIQREINLSLRKTKSTSVITRDNEHWKTSALDKASNQKKKWLSLFTEKQRNEIDSKLDWDSYKKIDFI
ncbi:hypothetical protein J2T55_001918 [Methylohalomonas lacus]|uniref:Sulfotransferase domain-containing protein n=2 Tax=Methylohalomonas lacus TaxID=398773 RepID=A0AAE3HMI7_9GAMM|nr:hypothetical protein [Methylohalomonas lacus]